MTQITPELSLDCELSPLHGSRRVDLGGSVGAVYLIGCKFRLALGNAGDRPLAVDGMKVDLQAEDLPPVSFAERDRAYGTALSAHQLFLEVSRSGFSGWWMLAGSADTSGEPRPLTGDSAEIFTSPGAPRMRFALDPGQSELIEGAILATEPGLYSVRLAAVATRTGLASIARGTSPIRICFADAHR